MKTVEFHESIGNVDSSTNFSYLLNFWHVSKLNKEFEYIKRNGIHPDLKNTSWNNTNDMAVTDGNPVQTYFYTVFRIFLKALFNGAEAFKTRDVDEWKVTYGNDNCHLDNLNYLVYKFNQDTMGNMGIIRPTHARYGLKNTDSFMVRLDNKDELHARRLLDELDTLQTKAKDDVDKVIFQDLNNITLKIAKMLDIKRPTAPARQHGTIAADVFDALNNPKGIEAHRTPGVVPDYRQPTPRPVVREATITERLRELLPTYEQLKSQSSMLPHRNRFSYILSFAKAGSSNSLINDISDNDHNFNAFMILTNNMTT